MMRQLPRGYSKKEKLYKVLKLTADGKLISCSGGNHTWELGKWYSVKGNPRLCRNGFHLVRAAYLSSWYEYTYNRIFEVDALGSYTLDEAGVPPADRQKLKDHWSKMAVQKCRLRRMLTYKETITLLKQHSGCYEVEALEAFTAAQKRAWAKGIKKSAKKTTRTRSRAKNSG